MNAHVPEFSPVTEIRTALHTWRSYSFTTARAPQPGFYAVGRGPEIYHRRGETFAPAVKRKPSRFL